MVAINKIRKNSNYKKHLKTNCYSIMKNLL